MIKLLKQTISQKQNDSSHWQTIGKHVSVELHWPNSKKQDSPRVDIINLSYSNYTKIKAP